jgi:predicted Fe-Mo cluster-binding NifX family protein
MKIAISSSNGEFNRPFNTRFGRCNYFVFVDSDNRSWDSFPNPAVSVFGRVGTRVVQFLSDHSVEVVISGRYGSNAYSALQAAGIQAYLARKGTPEELLEAYLAGKLKQVQSFQPLSVEGIKVL